MQHFIKKKIKRNKITMKAEIIIIFLLQMPNID